MEHWSVILTQHDADALIDRLELFLPSYADRGHSSELERKQDPVVDIFLTDEEAAAMLPS